MTSRPVPNGAYRPRLQRRLLLAFCGFTLVVATVLGALAIVFVYVVEDEFFGAALQAEVDRQQAHRATQGDFTVPALPYVRLYPRGLGLPPDLAAQHAGHPQRQEFEGAEGRHYHLRRVGEDGTLLVAEVSAQLVVRPMRSELLNWLLAAAGVLTLLALLLGGWLSRLISAPLTTLATRVARSAPDALPEELARGLVRDEVGELARHLDVLHARTRALIAREQSFTADASHELRTPLAVLGVAAERLQAQATAEQQPLVRSIQAAAWQLGQTVDLMLALAREAPAGPTAETEQPLRPALERLVLAHAPLLDREQVEVELDVPATVTRPWSPALTHLLVGNLLANAMAHTQARRIVIEADATELRVRNPSLPPPAALLGADAAGRARGVKGVASAGQGLGLSIVRRLAERHGLALELRHQDGQTSAVVRPLGAKAHPAPRR
ncbi:MAG: HAMP domain-containing histidine kinase [Rubrivivax sp.]|nr:HAMP domain-containing histidine kinase [Rubrivivax sp.]